MAKNLSERIAERMREKKTSAGAKNRGVFLALKSEVAQALDDGWPMRKVWEQLHEEGKVSFSYQAFRRYVNSLIATGKQEAPAIDPKTVTPKQQKNIKEKHAAAPVPHTTAKTINPVKPAATGFNFDAKPNREDYL